MEILIVEDDPSTRVLLTQLLTARGHQPTVCETGEAAQDAYRQSYYPLVFLDLGLPGMSGFDFCRWLRAQADGDRPHVLVGTASTEARDLRQILDAGADDYLVKPYRKDLFEVRMAVAEQSIAIRSARRQLAEELGQERERLLYLATHDSLTKLFSREQFIASVTTAVEAAGAGGPQGALLYVDLDQFKLLNYSLDYDAGDRLLVQIAYLLRNAVRPHDTIARVCRDEFAVLQENITRPEARVFAERIRAKINDLVFLDSGRRFDLGACVGVAPLTGSTSAGHLLAAADAACYTAKLHGPNRVELAAEGERGIAHLCRDAVVLDQVRSALRANTLELWFQPVIRVDTGRADFHDASLRLRMSTGELVEAEQFTAAAERFGLMPEIDRRLVRLVVRHLAAQPDSQLAFPLSGRSFDEHGQIDFIIHAFQNAHVAPERVTLTLTEKDVLVRPEAAHAAMAMLGRHGFRFALYEVAVGGKSLEYLKDLPLDHLGIGADLCRSLDREPVNLAVVKTLNDVAHHLGICSRAVGVGSGGALKALQTLGVDFAQGHYFAAPGPVLTEPHSAALVPVPNGAHPNTPALHSY